MGDRFMRVDSYIKIINLFEFYAFILTHGSGVYSGLDLWRIYCVVYDVRKASAARKSRGEINPGAGLSLNPVRSINRSQHYLIAYKKYTGHHLAWLFFCKFLISNFFFSLNFHHLATFCYSEIISIFSLSKWQVLPRI